MPLFLFSLFLYTASSVHFSSAVSNLLAVIFGDWFYSYSLLNDVSFSSTTVPATSDTLNAVLNDSIDFFVSSSSGENLKNNPELVIMPIFSIGIVSQVNIPELGNTNLILHRRTVANIFLGKITSWNDPEILCTNELISDLLPNQTIQVIYLTGTRVQTAYWTEALSSFSPEWNRTIGTVSTLPETLTNKTQFFGVNDTLSMFAKIVTMPYSIGYLGMSYLFKVNAGAQYVTIINRAGLSVSPTTSSVADASANLVGSSIISGKFMDSPNLTAWPIAVYQYIVFKKDWPDCVSFRAFLKFLYWLYMDEDAKKRAIDNGAAPLSANATSYLIDLLLSQKCGGEYSLAYVNDGSRAGIAFIVLLSLSFILLCFVLGLTVLHMHHFRNPPINLIYSGALLVGSLLTFLSTIAYYLDPTTKPVCQARIWLTGLGFSVLLGTMFARTSQLREIYLLQKKQLDAVKYNITLQSALLKLLFSLGAIIAINFLLLLSWLLVDPYQPRFMITDQYNFQGHWECKSDNYAAWQGAQIAFLTLLILWGLFVIYQTWSFQKTALIIETRWVLMALYNIFLSFAILIPVATISKFDDMTYSLIVVTITDFSAGGIVFAVLLPRLLTKLEWSTHSQGSEGSHKQHQQRVSSAKKRTYGTKESTKEAHSSDEENERVTIGYQKKHRHENSRTPEPELISRLEAPQSYNPHSDGSNDNKGSPDDNSSRKTSVVLVSAPWPSSPQNEQRDSASAAPPSVPTNEEP